MIKKELALFLTLKLKHVLGLGHSIHTIRYEYSS